MSGKRSPVHCPSITNLWATGDDANRLYSHLLLRLNVLGYHERIVTACRQIRRQATRGPGRDKGLFTFFWEIDALCELKDYRGALRQLRRRDAVISEFQPKRLRRTRHHPEVIRILATDYAPLFYFLGRYREGCRLLEEWLATCFQWKKVSSFSFWLHVINPDTEPTIRQCVTLSHFYRKLGKDLRDWRYWSQFVRGFHPRLLRLAGIAREALLADSRLLTPFCENLLRIRDQRTFTGKSGGLSDLIQSAAQVRQEQRRIQRQLDASSKWIQPRIDQNEARIRELFPELLRPPE